MYSIPIQAPELAKPTRRERSAGGAQNTNIPFAVGQNAPYFIK